MSYTTSWDTIDELEKLLKPAAKEFETGGIEYVVQIGNDVPLRRAVVKNSAGYHHVVR
ncbi:hypothetical protein [Metapseudomonas otitidis]|uniref:hypothetical protein n=1 Tax=Metapseudomonas otitidis TaxID=319939 RepID=UPI0013F603E1|nr:hypothetical protein [Pseudomonas otitidis]